MVQFIKCVHKGWAAVQTTTSNFVFCCTIDMKFYTDDRLMMPYIYLCSHGDTKWIQMLFFSHTNST